MWGKLLVSFRNKLLTGVGGVVSVLLFVNAYGEWKTTANLSSERSGFQGCLLTDGRMMIWGGTTNSGTSNTYEIFDPATGNWTTGTIPTASGHTMGIHLPNGKVLYIDDSGGSWSYDPFTNNWTGTASFGTWYDRGCATLLKDGKVLAMGFNTSIPTRCVLYDYATNSITPAAYTNQDHTNGPVEVLLPSGEVLLAGGYSILSGSQVTEIYNPASGVWTQMGNMNLARAGFVGILLPPPWNKVLVAADYDQHYWQTELFDVASGIWAYTAGTLQNSIRDTPCLIMLPCGKPLLIGGGYYSGPMPLQAEIFDPSSETWTLTSQMISGRSHFTSVILHTGKALAVAGYSSSSGDRTNTCEIYDPSEPVWTTKTSLNNSRITHTATLLPIIHTSNCSTNVLVTGGENIMGYIKSCELYNYINETVTLTGDLNVARSHHTAVLLSSGKVLVVGGKNSGGELKSCELYDVSTEIWSFTGEMGEARFDHTATLLKDGKVLVTGGESSAGYMGSCEIYDPGSSNWTNTGNLNIPRARHTVTLLLNGKVLVVGGQNASGAVDTCEIWDPGTGTWTKTGKLITPRYSHTTILLQSGKPFAIGGKNTAGNAIANCEVYTPTSGTWASGPSLNQARYWHTATLTYSGLVLVIGGFNGTNYLSSCEIFDPAIKQMGVGEWKITAQLANPRAYHTSCVIPDEKPYVLTIGGEDSSGCINSVEEYDQGLGYMSDWQSTITNYPSVTQITNPMNIEGTLFRGVSEADGGNHCHIASSDHPIIALLRVGGGNFQSNGGGEVLIMPLSSYWDVTHTTVQPSANAPQGYYALWSIVNGIPCKWYKGCVEVEESSSAEVYPRLTECKVYPNPATTKTGIRFKLPALSSQLLTLKIYDCSGRMLKKEIIECASPGVEEVRLDIRELTKGIYFYSIESTIPISKGKFVVL